METATVGALAGVPEGRPCMLWPRNIPGLDSHLSSDRIIPDSPYHRNPGRWWTLEATSMALEERRESLRSAVLLLTFRLVFSDGAQARWCRTLSVKGTDLLTCPSRPLRTARTQCKVCLGVWGSPGSDPWCNPSSPFQRPVQHKECIFLSWTGVPRTSWGTGGRQVSRGIIQTWLCLGQNKILGFYEHFLELCLGNYGNQSWVWVSG